MISRESLARFADRQATLKPESAGDFDMEGYIARHSFRLLRRKRWTSHPGGWIFEVAHCPFNASHDRGSAAFTLVDGRPGFKCQHQGCADKKLSDVFALYPLDSEEHPAVADGDSADSESLDHDLPRKNQSQLLIECAATTELFHTSEGEAFASFPVRDHRETWPLRGKAFRRWLTHQFYLKFEKPPSPQALQDAIGVLEARAQYDSPGAEVFIRVAPVDNGICIDLCNESWEAVLITPAGWEVVAHPPVRFRRSKGMLPLPRPDLGGTVSRLRGLINIGDDKNWILLLSWLLAAGRPHGPYPVLILQGEQGSAKSTTARLIRRIIDPSTALLRTAPREERDLVIAANNSWVIAYDNLSSLPQWFSDALCRLATGGGFSTRELYTDTDEVILDVQRPVILNSIDHLPERPDLAERSIILTLPRIDEFRRRDEAQLSADYERELPEIFGAFCDALSGALRRLPEVQLPRKPRMADFALWATAGEKEFGFAPGSFLTAYSGNRAEAVHETLDYDAVAPVLIAFMTADIEAATWMGTSGELLAQLEALVGDGAKKSSKWPKSPRGLSGDLRRLAPFLREAGIEVAFGQKRGTGGQRLLSITRKEAHPTVSTVPRVPKLGVSVADESLSGCLTRDGRESPETIQPSRKPRPSQASSHTPLTGEAFPNPETEGTVGTVVCGPVTDELDISGGQPGRVPVDSCARPERPMSRTEAK